MTVHNTSPDWRLGIVTSKNFAFVHFCDGHPMRTLGAGKIIHVQYLKRKKQLKITLVCKTCSDRDILETTSDFWETGLGQKIIKADKIFPWLNEMRTLMRFEGKK